MKWKFFRKGSNPRVLSQILLNGLSRMRFSPAKGTIRDCCNIHNAANCGKTTSSVKSAYTALTYTTEAGPRSSRSLMSFASRTYYELEPYLIITLQT